MAWSVVQRRLRYRVQHNGICHGYSRGRIIRNRPVPIQNILLGDVTDRAVGRDAPAKGVSALETGIIDERVSDRCGPKATDEGATKSGKRCDRV